MHLHQCVLCDVLSKELGTRESRGSGADIYVIFVERWMMKASHIMEGRRGVEAVWRGVCVCRGGVYLGERVCL